VEKHANDAADLNSPGEASGNLVNKGAIDPAHVGKYFNEHVHRRRNAASRPRRADRFARGGKGRISARPERVPA
jgi:hypothetical protein